MRIYSTLGTLIAASIVATVASAQTIVPMPPVPRVNANCREAHSGFGTLFPGGGVVGINTPNTLECGFGSSAPTAGAVAVGPNANAASEDSSAFGFEAAATAPDATAVGAHARATGPGATALGAGASAAHASSTALGSGASTTAPNQVALGGPGTSVRIGDIAASTAAQVGPRDLVTVDASGTLGRLAVADLTGQAQSIAGLQAAQQSLFAQVGDLAGVQSRDRRDARQGIVSAMAMGSAPMPSAGGRTSYVFNLATFRGEQAIGGSLMHRLRTAEPLAITVGFSFAGNRNNGARVGIAGEF